MTSGLLGNAEIDPLRMAEKLISEGRARPIEVEEANQADQMRFAVGPQGEENEGLLLVIPRDDRIALMVQRGDAVSSIPRQPQGFLKRLFAGGQEAKEAQAQQVERSKACDQLAAVAEEVWGRPRAEVSIEGYDDRHQERAGTISLQEFDRRITQGRSI